MSSQYISVKILEINDKEFSPKILEMMQIPYNIKNLKIIIDWLEKKLKLENQGDKK